MATALAPADDLSRAVQVARLVVAGYVTVGGARQLLTDRHSPYRLSDSTPLVRALQRLGAVT